MSALFPLRSKRFDPVRIYVSIISFHPKPHPPFFATRFAVEFVRLLHLSIRSKAGYILMQNLNIAQRIGTVLFACLCAVCALFAGIIFLLSVVYTAHFDHLGVETLLLLSFTTDDSFIVFGGIAAAIVFVGLLWLFWRYFVPSKYETPLFIAVLVLTALFALWWVVWQQTVSTLYADSNRLLKFASEAASGDWSSFTDSASITILSQIPDDAHAYFTQYPFQSGIFWFMYLLFCIAPSHGVLLLQLVNVVACEATMVLVYGMGRILMSQNARGRSLLLLLLVLCLPLYLSAAFPYGNAVGLALVAGFLYMQLQAFRSHGIRQFALITLSLIPFALMIVVKSTFLLMGIAAVITWFLHLLIQKKPMPVIVCVCVVLLGNSFGSVPTSMLEKATGMDFGEGMPKTSWIVMGLNESTVVEGQPGWWDGEAYEIMYSVNGDMEQQSTIAKERILEELQGFVSDPSYALSFFAGKLTTEWAEPTFASLYYSALNQNASGETFNSYGAFGHYYIAGALMVALDGYQIIVYGGALIALIALVRNARKTSWSDAGPASFLAAVFFTGFGCYLLWEAKAFMCYRSLFYCYLLRRKVLSERLLGLVQNVA